MSSQKVTGDRRYRSVIVEDFRSFATVGEFEEDDENAQIHEECQVLSEEIKLSKVKPDVVVASNYAADAQAAVAETSADVDWRRKLLEQFEREKQLILDELQREEMVTADYHNSDQLHRAKGLRCLNRSQELPSPNDQQGIEPLLESSLPHEEVSEESHSEYKSQSGIPALSSENRSQKVNEFSLLSPYLPSAPCDRDISTESEIDRLSRQVQVLVHQLAGCRQNLLRAEIEVGVLHEENRELRCLIKDLLAAYPRH